MAKKIDRVSEVLGKILSLYTKLCNTTPFTHEVGQQILKLEDVLKVSSEKFTQDPIHTQQHFQTLLQTKRKLAVLTIEEANIMAKLISIQAYLTPHMEILQKEQAQAKNLLKKDPNLSTLDGLVHLAIEIAISLKTIDVALDN